MHIRDILSAPGCKISFEFFPVNTTEARDRLNDTLVQLEAVSPSFVSVTYGAGGATREATRQMVGHLRRHTSMNPVPHLTSVRQEERDLQAILEEYAAMGVSGLLALRGDPPRDHPGHDHTRDAFPYGADLVRFIRRFNELGGHPDRRGFGIGVAGYPEGHPATPNRLLEMDRLKAKVDEGADYICTQLFFDNRDFHDFRERCELAGIRVPVLAGILPVTTVAGLRRMAALAGGARIPAKLLKALCRAGDDPWAVGQAGLHHATEQCFDLLHHDAAGIHFYTLNQCGPVLEILRRLGLGGVPPEPPRRAASSMPA